ncbi:hypothetical protein ABIC28_003002 [Rhodococcus sp. PvR044]|uniref:hypothetical protein n=1 Tax=Rhodococcus sp. PvR044 TaxID=3156402 RepID=UPI003391C170
MTERLSRFLAGLGPLDRQVIEVARVYFADNAQLVRDYARGAPDKHAELLDGLGRVLGHPDTDTDKVFGELVTEIPYAPENMLQYMLETLDMWPGLPPLLLSNGGVDYYWLDFAREIKAVLLAECVGAVDARWHEVFHGKVAKVQQQALAELARRDPEKLARIADQPSTVHPEGKLVRFTKGGEDIAIVPHGWLCDPLDFSWNGGWMETPDDPGGLG